MKSFLVLLPALVLCVVLCDAQAPCTLKNGTKVPDGKHFQLSACDFCSCNNGSLRCHQIQCAACPSGSSPKSQPGQCCPSCEPDETPQPTKSSTTPTPFCRFPNGTKMPNGASYPKNRCTNCSCHNGQLFCPPPPCPPPPPCKKGEHQKMIPAHGWNQCCPQFKCVPDTNSTVMTPTATPSSSCKLSNGSTVPDGSHYQTSPCTHCMCRRGRSVCYVVDCPRPPTCAPGMNLAVLPGKCCPTCQKDCKYQGTTYRSGSKFMASDGCNTCSCTDGKVFCTMKGCLSPCATVRCPSGKICKLQQVQCIRAPCPPQAICVDAPTSNSSGNSTQAPSAVTPTPALCAPGLCKKDVPCSISGGKAMCGCNYRGTMYKNGDIYAAIDGCNTCFCTNGTSTCTKKLCPEIGCKNITCSSGNVCQMQTVVCKKEPCPRRPVCVPKATPTVVPPSCPLVGCRNVFYCRYGYATGADGCFICQCNPMPAGNATQCPQYRCRLCAQGNVIDPKTGCVGCQCAPPPADQCKFDRVLDCFASRNVTGLQTGPGAPMASQSLCETVKDAMACHKRVRASGAMRGCNSTQNQTLSTVVASVTNLLSYNCPKIKCYVGGKAYGVNDSFPDATGCNTCYCASEGASCTLKHCIVPGCRYAVTSYADGKKFPALDGCNECSCDDGKVTCTKSTCTVVLQVQPSSSLNF
ncbi:kielin/chordin-like protein isoform X2 [Oscarella lobularis]|uniref:kielin/chordin-like protein isoform X2 n=1 Tax=Oscarella lobularis TaxID=121494 RepID=UPI00331353CA